MAALLLALLMVVALLVLALGFLIWSLHEHSQARQYRRLVRLHEATKAVAAAPPKLVGTLPPRSFANQSARATGKGSDCMAQDIFDFWARVAPGDHVHPDDRDMLSRIDHGFDLRCLPGQLAGLLRTAPIVLLFLSGGLSDDKDLAISDSEASIDDHRKRRQGLLPLWGPAEHLDAWKWWTSRTKCFGVDWRLLQANVAVLNIGAYHSKHVINPKLLAALPSSKVSRAWAQDVLFPQAQLGDRVVVCLRAAKLWGLNPGQRYGQSLFAPNVTRGGHMFRDPLRDEVIAAGREILRRSASGN